MAKRDYVEATAVNHQVTYIANVEVGNPGQSQQVVLDTGSALMWVWGSDSGAATTYNSTASSDSHYVKGGFQIGYVGGEAVGGDFYNDTFTWGGIDCTLEFGIASHYASGDSTTGILGVGVPPVGSTEDYSANLPTALKQQGFINTIAYSLYLDDFNAASATILFGAVDTSKFDGKLTVIDCSPGSFTVPVSIDGQQSETNFDCGTSLAYIPESILNATIDKNWAGLLTYDPGMKLYRLNGPDRPQGTMTFTFNNEVNITLGPDELWMTFGGSNWYLGIFTSESIGGDLILGEIFLRSAYVVYDAEYSRIAIAPAKYNGGEPVYEPIMGINIPGSS